MSHLTTLPPGSPAPSAAPLGASSGGLLETEAAGAGGADVAPGSPPAHSNTFHASQGLQPAD
jgi:hypothetical protein